MEAYINASAMSILEKTYFEHLRSSWKVAFKSLIDFAEHEELIKKIVEKLKIEDIDILKTVLYYIIGMSL